MLHVPTVKQVSTDLVTNPTGWSFFDVPPKAKGLNLRCLVINTSHTFWVLISSGDLLYENCSSNGKNSTQKLSKLLYVWFFFFFFFSLGHFIIQLTKSLFLIITRWLLIQWIWRLSARCVAWTEQPLERCLDLIIDWVIISSRISPNTNTRTERLSWMMLTLSLPTALSTMVGGENKASAAFCT